MANALAYRVQHRADLGVIAGVIGARQAVELAAASTEMRHDAAPSEIGEMREQGASVMRLRVALEAVEQHDDRRVGRGARIEPIEVPEVTIVGFDALPAKRDSRAAQ